LGDIAQIGQGLIYQLISEPHLTTIRVLGASEEIPVPPTMMLGASANNVKFDKPDMFRRMVMLNLDPKTADAFIDAVNAAQNINVSGGLSINRGSRGMTLIGVPGTTVVSGGGSTSLLTAYCKDDAGSSNTITASKSGGNA
jgi:hypothetical protein